MLDELDSYKQKILYFLQNEDDKDPEKQLEIRNLKFHERIQDIEFWQEKHINEYKKMQDGFKRHDSSLEDCHVKISLF